jgi:hypothetical protein
MLAGMQLDLFTPLRDDPLSGEQTAAALGVGPAKLRPLLYALVVAGLLHVDAKLFGSTDVANRFLVWGSPSCMVDAHKLLSDDKAGAGDRVQVVATDVVREPLAG